MRGNSNLVSTSQPEIYSDPFAPRTAQEFSRLLAANPKAPLFIGRLGGSDFEAVAQSLSKTRHFFLAPISAAGKVLSLPARVPYVSPFSSQHRANVRALNGYFDADDSRDNYRKYLETMISAYLETKVFTYATRHTQDAIDKGVVSHPSLTFLESVSKGKKLFTYSFIELVDPFVSSMHAWAADRKVLVVSPFSKSVEFQWTRRSELLINSTYPKMHLSTYTTPVTYSSSRRPKKKPVQAQTSNWNTELERIKNEVLQLDFDFALLSCASYAMPLGLAIEASGRSAIYVGGALNPMFNVYGERFAKPPYSLLVNPKTTIDAIELSELDQIREGRTHPNEALRAYIRNTNK